MEKSRGFAEKCRKNSGSDARHASGEGAEGGGVFGVGGEDIVNAVQLAEERIGRFCLRQGSERACQDGSVEIPSAAGEHRHRADALQHQIDERGSGVFPRQRAACLAEVGSRGVRGKTRHDALADVFDRDVGMGEVSVFRKLCDRADIALLEQEVRQSEQRSAADPASAEVDAGVLIGVDEGGACPHAHDDGLRNARKKQTAPSDRLKFGDQRDGNAVAVAGQRGGADTGEDKLRDVGER